MAALAFQARWEQRVVAALALALASSLLVRVLSRSIKLRLLYEEVAALASVFIFKATPATITS